VARAVLILLSLAACQRGRTDDGPCRCTPGNKSQVRGIDEAAPLDGTGLLAKLREHRRLVGEHKNPRDVKVFDDELRFAIANFCDPCNDWISDRMTIEELYPLSRLDEATGAVCLGFILRDSTMAFGDARPRNCR